MITLSPVIHLINYMKGCVLFFSICFLSSLDLLSQKFSNVLVMYVVYYSWLEISFCSSPAYPSNHIAVS